MCPSMRSYSAIRKDQPQGRVMDEFKVYGFLVGIRAETLLVGDEFIELGDAFLDGLVAAVVVLENNLESVGLA